MNDFWIAKIGNTLVDYPNDIDDAIVVYFTGCDHGCKGCQNPELQKWGNSWSVKYSVEQLFQEISERAIKSITNKVVFSGGDPLFYKNRDACQRLLTLLKENGYETTVYTGYEISTVRDFRIVDFKYIKCGKFQQGYLRPSGQDREKLTLASPNQDFYDEAYNKVSVNGIFYY